MYVGCKNVHFNNNLVYVLLDILWWTVCDYLDNLPV